MIRALLATVLLVASATALSCKVNQYCLNCDRGDGGGVFDDAGTGDDGGIFDASIDADLSCAGAGVLCPNQVGVCAGGIEECVADSLKCSRSAVPESCNGLDDDCDGVIDNGDPGGGAACPPIVKGECKQGVSHCTDGMIQCFGAIDPAPEICDGKDNDCDGVIDNGLTNMGPCGDKTCVGGTSAGKLCMVPTDCTGGGTCMAGVGECKVGQLACQGGTTVCVDPGTGLSPAGPSFEICDGKDNDCDGVIDNGFNLMTDPTSCGACNHACGSNLPNMGNAVWGCSAGVCTIASCQPGYHDNNNNPADGCEFGSCFVTGPEVCDGVDNDCDGIIDEDVGAPPAICATQGECLGTTATCDGAPGWRCHYGATVSTAGGLGLTIIGETKCDGLDNDCNGIIDDGQPQVAHADGTPPNPQACDDGKKGLCRGTGHYQCDMVTPTNPAVCTITVMGQTPQPESCNNLDDDCDGFIDNDVGQMQDYKNSGNLPGGGQAWINIGGGHQMMKYEASEPDATATATGNIIQGVCSKPAVQPWSNVKYPAALAACQSIGATLCSEQEWHRACSVVNPTTYPLAVSGAGTLIEAEDYAGIAFMPAAGPTYWSWDEDQTAGFSGMSALIASPHSGANVAIANAPTLSPRLDFLINFTVVSASYHVWVKMYSTDNVSNQVYVGVTTLAPPQVPTKTLTQGTFMTWQWVDSGAINIAATGNQTVSVFMGKDGVKVDAIFITTSAGTPNPPLNPAGNQWAYANPPNPNVYSAGTCNDANYQATPAITTTGLLTSCYANDGMLTGGTVNDHAFDMSGNVKEWVNHHAPGQNPIRGGSFGNTGVGVDCPLSFTLANDTFFFPDVGFRCCR